MDTNQDWPSVYPTAAPFKPSAVPLPVRMGYPVKKGVPLAKEGNLELLKVNKRWAQGSASSSGVLIPDPPHLLWEASSRESSTLCFRSLFQIMLDFVHGKEDLES